MPSPQQVLLLAPRLHYAGRALIKEFASEFSSEQLQTILQEVAAPVCSPSGDPAPIEELRGRVRRLTLTLETRYQVALQ